MNNYCGEKIDQEVINTVVSNYYYTLSYYQQLKIKKKIFIIYRVLKIDNIILLLYIRNVLNNFRS